jgi:hypothetical protein
MYPTGKNLLNEAVAASSHRSEYLYLLTQYPNRYSFPKSALLHIAVSING